MINLSDEDLAHMTRTLADYYARSGAPTWASWLYAEARMFEKQRRQDLDDRTTQSDESKDTA